MKKLKIGLAALCWMLVSGALAAEFGVALKVDDIRAEPFGDAKSMGKLAVNDKVDILSSKGGWLQIKSAKGKGWVRMLSIRKGDVAKKGNAANGLLSLASGRAGTGKVVATTGIRGLSEEELRTATFNPQEVTLAESYLASAAQAQQFASEAKLQARQFEYLPVPK
jgi:hypothetical protein